MNVQGLCKLFAVIVISMLAAACSGSSSPTAPTPNAPAPLVVGQRVDLTLADDWSGGLMSGGQILLDVRSITPGSGTHSTSSVTWINFEWVAYTTVAQTMQIEFRKFNERPAPWNPNDPAQRMYSSITGDWTVNLGTTGYGAGSTNPVVRTHGQNVQGPERIEWLRIYVIAANDHNTNDRNSRIVGVIDFHWGVNFTA